MSGLFGSLGVAYSGMNTYKTWLDATADNIANVNTVVSTDQEAYQTKYVVGRAVPGTRSGPAAGIGEGSTVAGVVESTGDGVLALDPDHPLADANGMVRRPNVNLSDQMTNMIIAQRAYQANVTVFERARDAYLRALEIGK